MKEAEHPERVFRIARGNPWEIRPPRGSNRYDISDPDEPTMTLYTGETIEAALAEVLAPFRPDLDVIAAVNAIPADDDSQPASGRVPGDWLESRRLGRARIRPQAVIVDLTHPETIADLRNQQEIAAKAIECEFEDVDEGSLKASGPNGRRFTQTVAAHIYGRHYSGIRYGSRLGEGYYCIAGFVALSARDVSESEFIIEIGETSRVGNADGAMREVARIFGLGLPEIR